MLAIGSKRELFVDRLLIDRLDGARLKLHEPKPGGVAIRYGSSKGDIDSHQSFYTTVLKDRDTYRMYYRGKGYQKTARGFESLTCYGESKDGVHWIKPALGLVEVDGSTQNNAILSSSRSFCPFIDLRPGVPASERYKANAEDQDGLLGYISSDGIHWEKVREEAIVPRELVNHFDSQNTMFWSEVEETYVLYARHKVGGKRATARATSSDFINWTGPTLMTFSDTDSATPSEHFYTNQTHPYFRAPHIYISLPGRIFFERRKLPAQELEIAERDVASGAGKSGDCSDGVLMTTRAGSTRYDFTFMESFVRPGISRSNWTTRNNYPALGVLQTGPNEMSLYVQRDYRQSTAYLERMTLRLDGFASVNAPYDGGQLVTKAFNFEGDELEINYATSAAGSIRIELQDEAGVPIPGYTAQDCRELIGDEIERVVAWDGGSSVGAMAGRSVRLRFVMKDADVFSFRFRPKLARAGG